MAQAVMAEAQIIQAQHQAAVQIVQVAPVQAQAHTKATPRKKKAYFFSLT